MTIPSPRTIFWPALRVIMSIAVPPWIPSVSDYVAGGSAHRLREQRRAHRRVVGLVDDLEAAAVGDDDGRPQVRAEVLGLLGGAHRHVDLGLGRVAHADALGLGVRQLDLVAGE